MCCAFSSSSSSSSECWQKYGLLPVLEHCFLLCCGLFYKQSCIKVKKIKLQMRVARAGAGLAPWREGTSRGGCECLRVFLKLKWLHSLWNVSRVSRCKYEYIQRVKQCSHPGVLVIGVDSHFAPSPLPAGSPYGPAMERLEEGRRGEKSPCQRGCRHMSFRPYGRKVTGLGSNGIDLIYFTSGGRFLLWEEVIALFKGTNRMKQTF